MGRLLLLVAALALAALALSRLSEGERGLTTETLRVGATPVTVTRLDGAPPGPAVVIAHGFSGSRPLMRAFATTVARNGYVAVSFDFLGHGRHPEPLRGDVTAVDGATAGILAQLGEIAAFGREAGDGRVALLGHSMAGDVIARQALADPEIVATVAVSMFSPAVTAEAPRNLLMIVGGLEAGLTDEALRLVRLAHGPEAKEGETYGAFDDGSARRAVFAPGVEHIGVLYSRTAMAEAATWLDASFGREGPAHADDRGLWVVTLLAALVALGWPLARLLPEGAAQGGAGLHGWRFAIAAFGPAVVTPLILIPLDLRFLPVVVGDYLATHFALQGALTGALIAALGGARPPRAALLRALPAAFAVAAFALIVLGSALDAWVSAFLPIPERAPLILALLAGMVPYFLADEWLTRGDAPRFAYPLTKLGFLASLALAVALDLERLFFLIILAPAMGLFFLVYGLFSRWAWGRTGQPWVGGLANALVFAWAVGVTFPMVAG